jgi:Spy/CpxP family protein refolding chaperone
MKTTRLLAATLIALMLTSSISILAQPGTTGEKKGSGMTDEQKTKIKDLRIAAYKEVNPLENQLGELKAKQHTLTTADKPDMSAINANIDEMAKVQAKIMKIKVANHQQIRALLTDEQKMWFDNRQMRKGEGNIWRNRGNRGPKGHFNHPWPRGNEPGEHQPA